MAEFVISGLGDEVSKILSEQLDTFKQLGIDYIETRVIDGLNVSELTIEQAEAAKAEIDKKGMKVSAVSSPIGKSSITEPFEEKLELFRHVLEVAKIFGTNFIRVFSFYIPGNADAGIFRPEVMSRLKTMVKLAEQKDITLLVENDIGVYGDSPGRLLDLFQTIGSSNMRLTFDGPNFIKAGYEAYPEAFDMLYDYIGYVHIKDSLSNKTIVPFGKGDTCALEYLKRLNKKDYKYFLALEPHVHEIEGLESCYEKHGLEKSRSSAFQLAYKFFEDILARV